MDYILQSLSIGYSHKVIAADINAQIKGGELTCLTGRNGTGKSTLMRTLAGFLKPLGGSALLDGHDVSRLSPAERSHLISVVLTDRVDVDGMRVKDLVSVGRQPYTGFFGKMSSDDEEVVNKAIADVGMTDFVGRQVNSLSDGERQKVMIAKALAQQTPVILLDEPTAFLDYPSKKEMFQMLSQLCHEQGKAVLVSTHDLDIALPIADSVIEMK
ncbi:MAG: ABC transporter ATP-binding protein [Prevotella sp.]|nr:ABC transporter ATP-binding protein [Prevotella sp.]